MKGFLVLIACLISGFIFGASYCFSCKNLSDEILSRILTKSNKRKEAESD